MIYIKLDTDMNLIVTKMEKIYRGDNMNKAITFLIPTSICDDAEADEASVIFLSYIKPDGTADMDMLERSSAMYNAEYYQYEIPVTCMLSRYPGQIIMWLQICSGDQDHPNISKSGECKISVSPSKNMDDCFSDHQLTALYKMKKQIDALSGNGDQDGDDEWEDITGDDTEAPGDAFWEDM